MQAMLDAYSTFAARFSTDPNPTKSKSKAVFVVGRRTYLEKPALLLLCGKTLPYVAHATHLRHELHENGTMTMDTTMRRGAFIGKCLEIQEAFSFAAPAAANNAVILAGTSLSAGTATADQVWAKLWSWEPKMTDDETTTAEILLEALQQQASLHTQCRVRQLEGSGEI